jgi:O-antigen/teichoic acid export membrane protein
VKLFSRYVTSRLAQAREREPVLAQGRPFLIGLKLAADVVGKAAMLIITIVAARRLNADPFAIMAFAMATGWLFGVATDAGLSMHLARETARDPSRSRQLLFEVLSLRTGLAFLAATLTALLAPYMVPAHWRMQFVLIVLAQLAAAVTETVAHYFRGAQRSEIESAIHSASRLATLLLALVVLWQWRRLDYLGIAMLVPALVAMVVSMAIAARLSAHLEQASTRTDSASLTTGSMWRAA